MGSAKTRAETNISIKFKISSLVHSRTSSKIIGLGCNSLEIRLLNDQFLSLLRSENVCARRYLIRQPTTGSQSDFLAHVTGFQGKTKLNIFALSTKYFQVTLHSITRKWFMIPLLIVCYYFAMMWSSYLWNGFASSVSLKDMSVFIKFMLLGKMGKGYSG